MKRWMLSLLAALLLTGCGSRRVLEGTGIMEEAAICLDPEDLRTEEGWALGGDQVYFGQYEGEPILWRILPSSDTQETGENCLLLDCDASLLRMPFDGDFRRNEDQKTSPNEWRGSDLEAWLNGEFLETSFTEGERGAIALTALHGENTPYSAGDWAFKFTDFGAEDRVFLLSAAEAKTLYGDDASRVKSGSSPNWWLRSKFDTGGNGAASIHIDGHICSNSIQNFGVGVSPALNVRLSEIAFASAGEDGIWKLTLRDPDRTVSQRRSAKRSETGEITVFYAAKGEGIDRIGVLLTDHDDQVLYAGSLKPVKNGTGVFTLPEPLREKVCGADYHAYLLAMDTAGEAQIDYAGPSCEIIIP